MKLFERFKDKLLITAVIVLYVLFCCLMQMPCVIRTVTSIPCPGCGMTRAVLSALQLQFGTAFRYHMMFWSLPLLYLLFLFDGRLFTRTYCNVLLYVLLGLGFFVNWLRYFIFIP